MQFNDKETDHGGRREPERDQCWQANAPETNRWPDPKPLSATLVEVPQFDPDLLPESLRGRVIDLAERFQVPPDYPAAALIAMLAGAIGRRALIRACSGPPHVQAEEDL